MRRIGLLVILLLLLANTKTAEASGFNIRSIGGVSTNGVSIRHFWHTQLSPAITGDCVSGNVDVTLDGTASSVTCENNTWTYSMPAQSAGDHMLTFANSGTTISLTLTLGPDAASHYDGGTGGGTLLPTGTREVTLGIIAAAGMALALGRMLWKSES